MLRKLKLILPMYNIAFTVFAVVAFIVGLAIIAFELLFPGAINNLVGVASVIPIGLFLDNTNKKKDERLKLDFQFNTFPISVNEAFITTYSIKLIVFVLYFFIYISVLLIPIVFGLYSLEYIIAKSSIPMKLFLLFLLAIDFFNNIENMSNKYSKKLKNIVLTVFWMLMILNIILISNGYYFLFDFLGDYIVNNTLNQFAFFVVFLLINYLLFIKSKRYRG